MKKEYKYYSGNVRISLNGYFKLCAENKNQVKQLIENITCDIMKSYSNVLPVVFSEPVVDVNVFNETKQVRVKRKLPPADRLAVVLDLLTTGNMAKTGRNFNITRERVRKIVEDLEAEVAVQKVK